ncbi:MULTISPECIES: helix-turn-helix domain-containing protein [unclassified Exiguobacterium]|uniref:helix-turn-helix domain-containing protein n=1 Tax=unclassified Exiguobacterium TaxID=2644629 RepID=UPI0025C4DCC0|nr:MULTISPECIES: helix-turn-helix domain-containing protein [unclassified Exiguobacterium]
MQAPYLPVPHTLLRSGTAFASVHEKMIYLILESFSGQDGQAFPSYQTIADAVPCSKSTVKSCIQSLIASGRIEKVERFTKHGGQTSNAYRVLPHVDTPSPASHETTAPETSADSEEEVLKKTSLKKELVQQYESNLGKVSPRIEQELLLLANEHPIERIQYAIEEAGRANSRHFGYIEQVVKRLATGSASERPKQVTKRSRRNNSLFQLPNWVEREKEAQRAYEAKQQERQVIPDDDEIAALLHTLTREGA